MMEQSARFGRGLLLSVAWLFLSQGLCQAVRIGVLLKPNHREAWREFEKAIRNFNASQDAKRLGIEISAYAAEHEDDLFTVTHELCRQLSLGVTTVLISTSGLSDASVRSLFANTNVPRITTTAGQNCVSENGGAVATDDTVNTATLVPVLGVSMMPDLTPAVLDLAQAWSFRSAVFFYDSGHALATLGRLLQPPEGHQQLAITRMLRVSRDGSSAHAVLAGMERADPHGRKLVVLDCDHELAKDIVIRHVRDIYMGRRNYHYVLARPVVSHRYLEGVTEFAAVNITAFRFQNTEELTQAYNYKTTAEEAVIADSAQLLIGAYRSLREEPPARNGDLFEDRVRVASSGAAATSQCGRIAYLTHEQGRVVDSYLKGVVFDGKTGRVEFDERGCRVNFTADVIQVNGKNQWLKIGTWSSRGFMSAGRQDKVTSKEDKDYVHRVAATLAAPFLMRKARRIEDGRGEYEGFTKDLMDAISRISGIKYAIHVAKTTGLGDSWEGMVSEILNGETDLAVGETVVAADRWHDVDMTLPVLSTGLAAVVRRRALKGVGMRTFIAAFDWRLWAGCGASVVTVYVVLGIIGLASLKGAVHCCFEPKAATDADKHPPTSYRGPNTSCANFKARSISGRIVGSFWWVFLVLVFSAYTTELASYLKPKYEIQSWAHLDSTELKHMWVRTARIYFESTRDEMTRKLWGHIDEQGAGRQVPSLRQGVDMVGSNSPGNLVVFSDALAAEYVSGQPPCNTRVIRAHHTSRHIALAVNKNDTLRERLNHAIATMSETGELDEIKRKWWSTRCLKAPEDEPIKLRLFLPVALAISGFILEGAGLGLVELLVRGCNKLCIWARLKSERSARETDPPLKTIA
ncbi:glutamate receptor 1 [Rhipicephalus sanguineus]|uniref:glutamate receptor 1 n=1 Tax=Rhipicephalus sanguineus TaxID=34632 RepID=UPI001895236B|nr:glutamate receptor 1 [Rhipicephalus sanguineus]